jgi:indoleacetamide hydrolase
MTDSELSSLDAHQALVLLRQGRLGVQEYASALLRGVQNHAGLHALTHVDPEAVNAAARQADHTPARDRGLLHGLPMVVKDNIDVAGFPVPPAARRLPPTDPGAMPTAWPPLRAAGALVLGKSNLHEFALGLPVATSPTALCGTRMRRIA